MGDSTLGQDAATLVTGGSGVIGRALVEKLSKSGRGPIVSMYRLRLPDPVKNVFPVCSDLSSVDLLAAPLRGVDTVVALAWSDNIVGSEGPLAFDPTYKSVSNNIRCLKNLIDAMERAGTRRIIFASAIGASRSAKTNFLKEKYLGELAVINSDIPEKIIVRSSMVFSPELNNDLFTQSIVNLMKFPGLYPVPRSEQKYAPIHIHDLCQSLEAATIEKLDQPLAIKEVMGDECYKVEDLFKVVSEKYSRGSKLQLRGAVGNSLVPVFEKRGRYYRPGGPSIRDYLTLAADQNSSPSKGSETSADSSKSTTKKISYRQNFKGSDLAQ